MKYWFLLLNLFLLNDTLLSQSRSEDSIQFSSDTVISEVMLIINKLDYAKKLKEECINELISIIEDEGINRASKEIATQKLAESRDFRAAEYIIKNHAWMNYFDLSQFKSNEEFMEFNQIAFGFQKTGLFKLIQMYTEYNGNQPSGRLNEHDWWYLFPLFIEYFDDMTEESLSPSANYYLIKTFMIKSIFESYNEPWLLTDFMYANMSNKESVFAKAIKQSFDSQKKQQK